MIAQCTGKGQTTKKGLGAKLLTNPLSLKSLFESGSERIPRGLTRGTGREELKNSPAKVDQYG
jgi:hypothetical protein